MRLFPWIFTLRICAVTFFHNKKKLVKCSRNKWTAIPPIQNNYKEGWPESGNKGNVKRVPYIYFHLEAVMPTSNNSMPKQGPAEPTIMNRKYFLRILLMTDGTAEVVWKVLKNSGLISKLNTPFYSSNLI